VVTKKQMVAAAIWKIEKLQYLCFADRPDLKKKIGTVMCLVPPNRVSI